MNLYPSDLTNKVEAILVDADNTRIYNLQKSILLAKNALKLSKAYSLTELIAKSLSQLAFYYMISGVNKKAISIATKAGELFEKLGNEKAVADAKYTIASVHYKSDNLHLGLKYLLDCIVIYRKYNDYLGQAKTYKSLGTIYEYLLDKENAKEVYELAIKAAKICGNDNMRTNIYNPLSGIYLNQNNFKKATDLIDKAIAQKQQSGDIRGLAFSYYGKAKIYAKQNEYTLAEEFYNKSINIHLEMGEKLGLGYAYNKLGILFLEQDRFEDAINIANKALDLFEIFHCRMTKTATILLLYKVYDKQKKPELALHYLKIYLAEQDENVHIQTHQIISNYKIITNIEAKLLEDQLHIEKAEHIAQSKQDFLSNMSHEIRTPLNAVISITNLLSEKENASQEDTELLGVLKYSSNNLLSIVNNVLDFTKLEEGKVELEKSIVHFRSLLNNIKNTYSSLAKDKGLQLELLIDEKIDIAYELDATKLAQILGNLLGNAIKFTDEGTVTLSIEKVSENKGESKLLFKVKDTGNGIPDDFVDKLFDKFSQPKLGIQKNKAGSGLGLTIVKELVNLHGSQIYVNTKIGEGTVFSFTLMLTPKTLLLETSSKTYDDLSNLNVLIAEDNKVNMLVALKILHKWGIKPDTAINGKEASEKTNQKKYDIILMDLQMPILNGFEAAIKIKNEDGCNMNTPIYAFTADITADYNAVYEQYFEGFLHKPIEVDLLHNALSLVQNKIESPVDFNKYAASVQTA
jgi:signal transduction histidine kinase/AmiR/NasT family two-component response regulator